VQEECERVLKQPRACQPRSASQRIGMGGCCLCQALQRVLDGGELRLRWLWGCLAGRIRQADLQGVQALSRCSVVRLQLHAVLPAGPISLHSGCCSTPSLSWLGVAQTARVCLVVLCQLELLQGCIGSRLYSLH